MKNYVAYIPVFATQRVEFEAANIDEATTMLFDHVQHGEPAPFDELDLDPPDFVEYGQPDEGHHMIVEEL